MDADNVSPQQAQQLPPDLVAHDNKYHHGHYDSSKGRCKYREDRAAAIRAREEHESEQDIIDRLKPEDVEGEEIDNADRLESTESASKSSTSVATLEAAIPKLKGVAARALQALLAKRKESDIESKLTKLRDLAKQLGLDPSKLHYGDAPSAAAKSASAPSEEVKKLIQKKEALQKDAGMIRDKMQNASPRLAALLQSQLSDIEKSVKKLDKQIASGGAGSAAQSEEEKRKAAKQAEKEAKKKAVAESKSGQSGAAKGVALDSIDDISSSKTSILSSSDFKKEFDALPADRKIFALSDFHDASMKNIDPSGHGTAIFAGDFTKHGATSHSRNISMDEAVKGGNDWLKRKFFKFCDKHKDQKIVLVAGNHDHFLGDPSADDIQWPENVSYLKDSETNVNGMRVYGTPWCEQRKGAAKTASMSSAVARQPFEVDDATIKEKFDKIPEGLDILVVHQTPKADGYDGDLAFVGGKMQHCGSEALTEAIKRAKPKLVICGHLHDGDHRPFRIGDSVVVNGAYVANRGDPSWTAHEIGMTSDGSNPGFFVNGEDNHQMNESK